MSHVLPIYVQIQEQLRSGIKRGDYPPGHKLPSENELALQFSTTRATVVHAMHGLLSEGLIERIRGKGTFVKAAPIVTRVRKQELGFFEKDLQESNLSIQYQVFFFGEVPATPALLTHLQLNAGAKIYRLVRLRLIDGRPLAVEFRYLDAEIAAHITVASLETLALQTLFEQQLGIIIHTIHNQVRVALPGQDVAKFLDIKRSRPVMVRQHTCLAGDDKLILWGETWYREEYEFQYSTYRDK